VIQQDDDEPFGGQTHDNHDGAGAGVPPGAEATPASAPTARRPVWRRSAELLLPAVLAAGAMGMHWWLNVPTTIVQAASDQGAKAKKADAKKNEDKSKDAERKRRPSPREEPRTAQELDAAWAQHGRAPFEDEPTRTAWARRHQMVINRAVVEARRHAFTGAPEEPNVVLASTTCRTVRCRFVLRSPFARELELMTAALQRMREGGEPLWRSFEVEPAPSTEVPGREPVAHHAVQLTVAFRTDETEVSTLEIPGADDEPEQGGEPDNGDEP
jgi:hypothetical protein